MSERIIRMNTEVERPDTCEPDDMWDQLIDLCQTWEDVDVVIEMRAQAEGRA